MEAWMPIITQFTAWKVPCCPSPISFNWQYMNKLQPRWFQGIPVLWSQANMIIQNCAKRAGRENITENLSPRLCKEFPISDGPKRTASTQQDHSLMPGQWKPPEVIISCNEREQSGSLCSCSKCLICCGMAATEFHLLKTGSAMLENESKVNPQQFTNLFSAPLRGCFSLY